MVYTEERRGSRGNTKASAGGTSDGKRDKLKVAYTNVDGLISSMLEIKDYIEEWKTRLVLHGGNKIKGRNLCKFPARWV